MDFNDTPDEATFRAEARAWLEANAEPADPDETTPNLLSEREDPAAIAGWKGAPLTNVRNCLAVRAAATRFAGPDIQPIFQPVVWNVLPPLEMVGVRSNIPGSVAIDAAMRAPR